MKPVLVSAFVLICGPAEAQVLPVCQTPWFWCGYASASPVPDGMPCACYSPRGPIPGRTVAPPSYDDGWRPGRALGDEPPAGENPAARLSEDNPALAPQPNPDPSPQSPASRDCLNGLGDCPGVYSAN